MNKQGKIKPRDPTRKHQQGGRTKPVPTDRLGRTRPQREQMVFEYILGHAVRYMGHTPTYSDIMYHCDITSTSAVRSILDSLIAQNRLRVIDGFLVIPGSTFTWSEQLDDGTMPSDLPAQHGATQEGNDGAVGVRLFGGD